MSELVTVITPTTGRVTLAQTCGSVAAQDAPHVHRVMHNNTNDFGNSARNQAVSESSTPYIATLDDDDWYEPHYLSHMLDVLRETGADLAYCRSHLHAKETGANVGTWFYPFNPRTLDTSAYILSNTVIGRREVFEQCPYNDAAWGYNADWHVYIDAMHKGFKIVSVDAPLSNCRVKDGAWHHWAAGGYLPAGADVPQFCFAPNAEVALALRLTFPALFAGADVLYVGAHPQSRAFADEIAHAGNVTLLEAWYPNALHYRVRGNPFASVLHGTLKESQLAGYDFALWIQGPEHVTRDEVDANLDALAQAARHAIVTCPFGEYPQGDEYGNPYERHLCALYPEDFQRRGWHVMTFGRVNDPNGCILAWT